MQACAQTPARTQSNTRRKQGPRSTPQGPLWVSERIMHENAPSRLRTLLRRSERVETQRRKNGTTMELKRVRSLVNSGKGYTVIDQEAHRILLLFRCFRLDTVLSRNTRRVDVCKP